MASKVLDQAVAIDGPGASGKTSVGREVARQLDFRFMDTGLMYRAATWQAIRQRIPVDDAEALTEMTQAMDIDLTSSDYGDRLLIDGVDATSELRTPDIDRNVSAVSAVEGVRRALVPQQRGIAEQGPIVMVGRDICTAVLPDARTKIYLDASAEVRAERRYAEMNQIGMAVTLGQALADLKRRDRIDSERAVTPLTIAEGAVVINTDDLTIPEVVEKIVKAARDE